MLDYNPRPDPLQRAFTAARRAVDVDPTSGVARLSLARAHFFMRAFDRFFAEADRAIALNPNNGDVLGTIGMYVAYAGEWEHGLALVRKAMELTPSYPGCYHVPFFWDHYRKGEYEAAMAEAQLLIEKMPEYWLGYAYAVAIYGQQGRPEEARATIAKLLELKPDYAKSVGLQLLKFNIPEEVADRYLNGLRKAGLDIPDEQATVD